MPSSQGTCSACYFFPCNVCRHAGPSRSQVPSASEEAKQDGGQRASTRPSAPPNPHCAGAGAAHRQVSGPSPSAPAQNGVRSAPAGAPRRSALAQKRPTGAPSPCAISEYAANRTYKRPSHASCLPQIPPPTAKSALIA